MKVAAHDAHCIIWAYLFEQLTGCPLIAGQMMNDACCLIVLPDKMGTPLTGWLVDHGTRVSRVEGPVRQY